MEKTIQQYQSIIQRAKDIFVQKSLDYGTSWRILRMPSLTDQIFIKAERIRNLQETGENKVGESQESEFLGIINYCVIALMLMEKVQEGKDLEEEGLLSELYDTYVDKAFQTMKQKNHDYGEAWRSMRVSSITDLILMKILRLKRIEDNAGKTLISEGADANYIDMLNYAVFCMIKFSEAKK
ncbi:MAG: DUF1599 domain-containing protein [Bacteroidota bacterium]